MNEEFFSYDEEFEFMLPVKKFIQLISLMNQEEIKISISPTKILIESGKSKHSMNLSLEKFPEIHNEISFNEIISINSEKLKQQLEMTSLSMSKIESAQFQLRAFEMRITPDYLQFSSCDGRQASRARLHDGFELSNDEEIKITFSFESLDKIKSFLMDKNSEIEISLSPSYIKFNSGKSELFINQGFSNFPDVDKLFFDTPAMKVEIDNGEFSRLLRLVKISEDALNQQIVFRMKDNRFFIELRSSFGEGQEFFTIDYPKEERKFSLNDKSLIEYLMKFPERKSSLKIFDDIRFPVNLLMEMDNQDFELSLFPLRTD
ncbi:MAG: hypothetical protein KG003_10005 [Bacteroidetes bacterium]|nr:hypothetical protein [Bacteroidota bacterium]